MERTFSMEDARTAGLWGKEGPWKTYPYRQMAWRAFWFAARDAAADLLKGLDGVEALVDIAPERDITPPKKAADVAEAARTLDTSTVGEEDRNKIIHRLESVANTGDMTALSNEWQDVLTKDHRKAVGAEEWTRIKNIASKAADAQAAQEAEQ